jgi:hypothetical protein
MLVVIDVSSCLSATFVKGIGPISVIRTLSVLQNVDFCHVHAIGLYCE